MLIKESQLLAYNSTDILDQLDKAVYLTQEESKMHLEEVPVVVKEDGKNLVDYEYLSKVSEQNSCSIFEAAKMLQESNALDSLTISVNEEDAIAMQEEFDPDTMVIKPLSEDSDELFWANYVCEQYMGYKIDDDVLVEALMSIDEAESFGDMRMRHKERIFQRANKEGKKISDEYQKKVEAFNKSYDDGKINKYERDDFLAKAKYDHDKAQKEVDERYNKRNEKHDDIEKESKARLDRIRQIHQQRKEEEANQHSGEEHLLKNASEPLAKKKAENQSEENRQQRLDAGQGEVGKEHESIFKPKPQSNNLPAPVAPAKEEPKQEEPKAAGGATTVVPEAPKVDVEALKDQPKSVIGKKIAALRKVYSTFMQKAQSSTDTGIKARIKKVAAKILAIIDKLLGFLQNKAG